MEHWENINAWLVEYIKQEKQKLDDLQGKQLIYLETDVRIKTGQS